MRHLQYMVFEAVSNVLQHANASLLCIELRSAPQGGALLRVVDNGCGFDPDRIKCQGLRSLRERAATIGAQLQVSSVAGNTVVQITLN
jgi:signal transduction histidine kinase